MMFGIGLVWRFDVELRFHHPRLGRPSNCSLPADLRGLPQVFVVAPAVNLGLGSLPPERLKYASGLFNMMRNLGGAVGIAVCSAIYKRENKLSISSPSRRT